MGRKRQYATDAERQAAHRARVKVETVTVDRGAHDAHQARLERLQSAIDQAARRGDPVAKKCRAASVDTMLERLAGYFEGEYP